MRVNARIVLLNGNSLVWPVESRGETLTSATALLAGSMDDQSCLLLCDEDGPNLVIPREQIEHIEVTTA